MSADGSSFMGDGVGDSRKDMVYVRVAEAVPSKIPQMDGNMFLFSHRCETRIIGFERRV